MAITNLQQARQLYAMGQRVAKTMDGSRPGYRGSDWGAEAKGTGAYSRGNTGTDDRSTALQTYNTKKATGTLGRQDANQMDSTVFYGPGGETIDIGYQGPLNAREQGWQQFLNRRPEVKTLPFGVTTLLKGPLQKFSDFNTSRNRDFFQQVVTAGKIPGVNWGNLETKEDFETAYQDYMSNRLAGNTDVYGNPIGGQDDMNSGITTLYAQNLLEGDGTSTSGTPQPFVSRFLQNQPEDIRSDIESRMTDYYTV